jgi:hypothetical protein
MESTMKIVDLLGNILEIGSVVNIKSDFVVGVITRIEDGSIVKGLSVSGSPKGVENPACILVKVELQTIVPAIGGVVNVLKLAAPDEKKSLVN